MIETKIICDKCKKELTQRDNYLIFEVEHKAENISYTGMSSKKYHYHIDCAPKL